MAFSAELFDDQLTKAGLHRPVDVAGVVARLIVTEVVELEAEAARANRARARRVRRRRGTKSAEGQPIEYANFLRRQHTSTYSAGADASTPCAISSAVTRSISAVKFRMIR